MTKHPECGEDEVFVTNVDDETWHKIGWRTKRKGTTAYTKDGDVITVKWPGAFPVFVKKSEIIEKDPDILESIERMDHM